MALPELLLVLACASPQSDDTGSGPVLEPPDESGALTLLDTNNFTYTGEIDAPSFRATELTDVSYAWSSLTKDLQCHDVDPVADIDNVALMVFPYLTEEEVEAGLSDDSLQQVDLGVYLSFEPEEATEGSLEDLTFFGTEANIYEEFSEGSGAWMLTLSTGTEVGVGTRMLVFAEPSAGEANTHIEIEDACEMLDFSADLSSATPLTALPDGPWLLDWSGATRTGIGGELDLGDIDSVMLAHYTDQSVEELEANFLDLELLASEMWTADIETGSTADLAGLTTDAGVPFAGFTEDGVWLLALRCSTCPNPAPLLLTVLVPWF